MDGKTSNMDAEKVFVCGAGHQGLSMAAHLSLNGVKVTLWNRSINHIEKIIKTKRIYCDGIIEGAAKLEKVSSQISEVISDFVMVATPSSAHRDVAHKLAPFVHKGMVIILNPGRTFGAVDFASELKKCGVKELPHIAETQTIVYTCRKKSSDSVTIFALKNDVKISALKCSNIEFVMNKMPKCIKRHLSVVDTVWNTSLSNVGMILHCAPVLMNIGWIETEKVDFKYYYDGISKSIAAYLEKMDIERQNIALAVGYPVESVMLWLKRTYGVRGSDLYECIQNNESYKQIDAPPTIKSRYILEDVPNGLVPIETLGKEYGISTPNISTIIDLACLIFDIDFRANGRNISIDTLREYI